MFEEQVKEDDQDQRKSMKTGESFEQKRLWANGITREKKTEKG